MMKQIFGMMNNRKITGCLLLCCSMVLNAASLNKIVMFGDSLSDTGNLYEYMKHQLPMSPPYYKGRFSNGPLWIELLTAHYYPKQVKAHLLNYAFGGSGVSTNTDYDDVDEGALSNLRLEVDSYLLAHQDKADPNSLIIVWMGSNNYLGLPDDQEAAVDDAITGIEHSLEKLVQKGAKHILLVTIPDLGLTPAARDFDAVDMLTEVSSRHNERLQVLKDSLVLRHPDVEWLLFDVNLVFQEMLDHPEKHGLHNYTDTCYDVVFPETSSSQTILKMAASIQHKTRRDGCDGYLFFDPVHPTFPAHQLMAKMLIDVFEQQDIRFS